MSKKKAFNEGAKMGIRLSEEIVSRNTDAMEFISKQVDNLSPEFGKLKEVYSSLRGDLEDIQVKELFGVINTFDYKEELEPEEKILVLKLLSYVTNKFGSNEEQKQYLSRLCVFLEVNPNDTICTEFDGAWISNIDSKKVTKALYLLVKEFLFLQSNSHDYGDKYAEVLGWFGNDVSDSDLEALINIKVKTFGIDFLYEQFGDEVEEIEDENGQKKKKPGKEIIIEEPMSIAEGETKKFENQTVIFKSFVGCSGNLIFENCELKFDDSDFSATPVTMEGDGKLEMKNCSVSCKVKTKGKSSFKDNYLFSCNENVIVIIDECDFSDCNNFINFGDGDVKNPNRDNKFNFTNSTATNCFNLFYAHSSIRGDFYIGDSQFTSDFITDDIIKQIRNGVKEKDEFGDVWFHSNDNLIEKINTDKKSQPIFDITAYTILGFENCFFKGVANCCVGANNIDNCTFENCFSCISSGNSKPISLKKNTFTNCYMPLYITSRFIGTEKQGSVLNITSLLIGTEKQEGVLMSECSFNDIVEINISSTEITIKQCSFKNLVSIAGNGITFNTGLCHMVENSSFDNINMHSGVLFRPYIMTSGNDLIDAAIRNCSFTNCKGTMVSTYSTQSKLFGDKKYQAVEISDCQGLN